jgi:uracil-DNA glycosylase family 4
MANGSELSPAEAFALLRWQVEMGAADAIDEAAVDRYAASAAAAAPPPPVKAAADTAPAAPQPPPFPLPIAAAGLAARPTKPPSPTPSGSARSVAPAARPAVAIESPQLIADAAGLAASCTTLAELERAIQGFDACALKRTARHTVFADGVAGADVMIVGEAPGGDEDRLGKPFVGVSGQLMDRMFATIGLERARNLYITNILFWRPPGNRKPTAGETAICLAFTRRHIELARPRILVLAGGTPASTLLETTEGITKLRGRWTEYLLGDGTRIPTLPTLHPAYLLRTSGAKRQSWRDLLLIQERLEVLRGESAS